MGPSASRLSGCSAPTARGGGSGARGGPPGSTVPAKWVTVLTGPGLAGARPGTGGRPARRLGVFGTPPAHPWSGVSGPRESPPRWPLRDKPDSDPRLGHSPRPQCPAGGGRHGGRDPDLSGGAGRGGSESRPGAGPKEPAALGAPAGGPAPTAASPAPRARRARPRPPRPDFPGKGPWQRVPRTRVPPPARGLRRIPMAVPRANPSPRTPFPGAHSSHTPVDAQTRGFPAQPGSVPGAAAPSPPTVSASRESNRLRIPSCHRSSCSALSCRRPALGGFINCQGRDRQLGPQRRHRPPRGHRPAPAPGGTLRPSLCPGPSNCLSLPISPTN